MACAVIMKMMSNTSATSTNGVTLISAMAETPRLDRPPLAPPTVIAIRLFSETALDQVQELERKIIQLSADFLERVTEMVVRHGRGYGGEQARGGCDQRVRNARSHKCQTGTARATEILKGANDSQNRSEQSDKRRHRSRGRQPTQVLFKFR